MKTFLEMYLAEAGRRKEIEEQKEAERKEAYKSFLETVKACKASIESLFYNEFALIEIRGYESSVFLFEIICPEYVPIRVQVDYTNPLALVPFFKKYDYSVWSSNSWVYYESFEEAVYVARERYLEFFDAFSKKILDEPEDPTDLTF